MAQTQAKPAEVTKIEGEKLKELKTLSAETAKIPGEIKNKQAGKIEIKSALARLEAATSKMNAILNPEPDAEA